MTHAVRGAGGVDLLTRTTLQLSEGLSIPSIAHLIKALQRVPGVLLAEIAAGSSCAIVAHDAAVPGAALLAAAERAGVHASITAKTPLPSVAASSLRGAPSRRVLTVAGVLLFLLALGETVFPRLAGNHFLLPILLSSVWAFVIARTLFKRRQ